MIKKVKPRESIEERISCLFTENCTKWLNYAIKHKVSREDAEDIIQNISVKFLARKELLENLPPHKQEAYVMESLKNAVKNHLTRTKQFEPFQEEFFPGEDSAEQIVLDNLSYDDVRKAVNRLSPIQREIIYMLYYQNMTVSQAAEKMCMTDNEVRSYKSRAVRTLRSILSEMEQEQEEVNV